MGKRMTEDRDCSAGSLARDSICVVTITHGRPTVFSRAIPSVAAQTGVDLDRHLILVDGDRSAYQQILENVDDGVDVVFAERERHESTGVFRLAKLRDLAAKLTQQRWIAYLDDDNEWAPDHLNRLLSAARSGQSPAAYSWREIVTPSGEPYLSGVFPWSDDEEHGRQQFNLRVELGICSEGSPIYKDDPRTEIDGGAWLLRTGLVRRLKFMAPISPMELSHRVGEDDKFLQKLLARGVELACSEYPSLRYYLGGDSNWNFNRGASS